MERYIETERLSIKPLSAEAWAYAHLGARDFASNHAVENVASERVIEKCGFQFSHYGQYSRFDGSETFDAVFYTLHME